MGFIIGLLVRIATFPGIILDAFVLEKLCNLFEIKVLNVDYFSILGDKEPVEMETPSSYSKIIGLTILPFLTMSALAILCFYIGLLLFYGSPILVLFIWIGISIATHSFPSSTFGKVLWKSSVQEIKQNNFIAVLGFPVVIIIYIARILHIFWLDIIYGILLFVLINQQFKPV